MRPDAILRYLNNMDSDIRDLDTLIEQMLALSKIDYQESALVPENLQVFPILSIP